MQKVIIPDPTLEDEHGRTLTDLLESDASFEELCSFSQAMRTNFEGGLYPCCGIDCCHCPFDRRTAKVMASEEVRLIIHEADKA